MEEQPASPAAIGKITSKHLAKLDVSFFIGILRRIMTAARSSGDSAVFNPYKIGKSQSLVY
jgi:hypothetical protein